MSTIYDTHKAYWLKKSFISESFQDLLSSSITPGNQILDLGCGGGRLSVALAEVATTYGLDVAGEMIQDLKLQYPEMNWIWGNAEDSRLWAQLPQFDAIVSNVCIRKDQCRLEKVIQNIAGNPRLLLRIQGSNDLPGYIFQTPCYSEQEIKTILTGWDCKITTERYQQKFTNLKYLRESIERIGLGWTNKEAKTRVQLYINREYLVVDASK